MVHLHVGELLQKATTAALPFLRLISEDCRRVELPLKLKLADLLEKWELTVSISGKQHAMKHEETNLLIFFFPLKKVSEVELTVFSFLSFPLNYKVRLQKYTSSSSSPSLSLLTSSIKSATIPKGTFHQQKLLR